MRVSRVMLVVSATAIGVMACKTDSSTAIAALDRVALIAVSLTSNRLTIGQSVPASVTLKNGSGTALSGKRVAWASANSAVAAVNSSSGMITGISAGSTVITAKSDGATGSAAVEVVQQSIARIGVTIEAPTIDAGETTRATAVPSDANGNALSGRTVAWSSANPAVATVDPTSGTITGVGAGTTAIVATSEGVVGSANIAVIVPTSSVSVALGTPTIIVGSVTQATATARDAQGNVLTGRPVTWSSSNASVATIDGSTGVVTGVSPGTATITAVSTGVAGNATVTVSAPPPIPVASIGVSLAEVSVNIGATTQASATLRDASGNVLSGRVVNWTSSNSAVATVDPSSGLVAGLAAGSATIIASSEGKTGSALVTIVAALPPPPPPPPPPAPVASVTVSLASPTISVGATTQASAVTKDASGSVLTGRTVSWMSSAVGIATINSTTGVVTGVAPGTANIVATSEGKTGSTTVTITALTPVATHIGITTEPSSAATSGAVFAQQPAVSLKDASNQTVALGGVSVHVALASGVGGTLAGGTTVMTNPSGTAAFSDLSIAGSGSYTLIFTAIGLSSTLSTSVTVTTSGGPGAVVTGISRDGGSASGGSVVQIVGTGFGASDAVTFGSAGAAGVTLLNATTLQATVPAHAPGTVDVSVIHGGVTTTLTNAFTYWPAPTTILAQADFENGSIAPFTASPVDVSSVRVHRGTKAFHAQATATATGNGLYFAGLPQSSTTNTTTGVYARWYILIPAATLANTAHAGQIKLFLSRLTTGSGQPGYFMLGEGSQFNSSDNSFAVNIDDGLAIVAAGPSISPDVWHEIQVYEYRDPVSHIGTSKVWFDGKLLTTATNPLLGSDSMTAIRDWELGLVYTQLAAGYPLDIYVDDVVIANGYVDPTP